MYMVKYIELFNLYFVHKIFLSVKVMIVSRVKKLKTDHCIKHEQYSLC